MYVYPQEVSLRDKVGDLEPTGDPLMYVYIYIYIYIYVHMPIMLVLILMLMLVLVLGEYCTLPEWESDLLPADARPGVAADQYR